MKVYEQVEAGYRRLLNTSSWTVAVINYAPRFDTENLTRLERHLKTDEVFVLLSGRATLVVGSPDNREEMKPSTIYVIEVGEWHHILLSPDAKVLVVENVETGLENTEYKEV